MRSTTPILRRIRRQSSFRRFWRRSTTLCRSHLLLSLTISSVLIGLLIGFALRGMNLTQVTVRLINFPGEIFMQVLKLMILPLIFSSLVSALAQMDARESGQMSLLTVGYYVITTVFATVTGVLLVLFIHPGDPSIKQDLAYLEIQHHPISPLDTFLDVIRNMFPENVVQATMQRVQTKYFYQHSRRGGQKQPQQPKPPDTQQQQYKNAFTSIADENISSLHEQHQQQQLQQFRKKIENVHGMNILGIIVFCTGFGIVISQLGERARIIVEFFIILEAVIMQLVGIFMWLTPLGIVSLIAGNLLELEDLSDTAAVLLLYILTVLSGLAIHTLFTMPLLYFLFTRRNPLKIIRGMFQALVTAFGTASGGAALPVSMRCMEQNLHVDRRIARFVLPLGSTINMDGNALYEAVAVIFIAQLNNVTLTMTEVVTVSFIATIASLGLNSVPAGLVSIFVILSTVGLPVKDIPLIITADWLLDRIRTCINVLGDAFVASTVSHYLEVRLEEADRHNEFHQQTLWEEAVLLRSVTTSRKPSFGRIDTGAGSATAESGALATIDKPTRQHSQDSQACLHTSTKLTNGGKTTAIAAQIISIGTTITIAAVAAKGISAIAAKELGHHIHLLLVPHSFTIVWQWMIHQQEIRQKQQ